jgi:hypothetical protein
MPKAVMVSCSSFPLKLRNSPEGSISLGGDNGCPTHEVLSLHFCSRCSERRIVAGNQLQFIAECAVAPSLVCSRLTAVPIQADFSVWYVKDLMERE